MMPAVMRRLLSRMTALFTRARSPLARVPRDLDHAYAILDRVFKDDTGFSRVRAPEDMVRYHFTVGLWMRNAWGLWAGSDLGDRLQEMGFFHPDDMSEVILESYWCRKRGLPFDFIAAARRYDTYWDAQLKPDRALTARASGEST